MGGNATRPSSWLTNRATRPTTWLAIFMAGAMCWSPLSVAQAAPQPPGPPAGQEGTPQEGPAGALAWPGPQVGTEPKGPPPERPSTPYPAPQGQDGAALLAAAEKLRSAQGVPSTVSSLTGATSALTGTARTVPSGFVAGVSQELTADATTYSTLYQNADGSRTVDSSPYPVNFQGQDGQWRKIDTSLGQDPSVPGGLVSGADTWHVSFAPIGHGGGVTIDSGGSSVTLVPQGTNAVTPEVNPQDPSSAIYPNAWDGATLEYSVSSLGLREDVLLSSPSSPTRFSFAAPGRHLGPPGRNLEGSGAGLPAGWSFEAPIVRDRRQLPHHQAGVGLAASAGGAELTVSPKWLHAQPASSFPIDVDPSIIYGPHTVTSIDTGHLDSFCMSSSGYSSLDQYPYQCPVTMGNNGTSWITMDNFTYPIDVAASPSNWDTSWPWPPEVTNVTINLSGTTNPGGATPTAPSVVGVYQSTAQFAYPDIKGYPGSLSTPLAQNQQVAGATSLTFSDSAPTDPISGYAASSTCGGPASSPLVAFFQTELCNWASSADPCYSTYHQNYGCGGYLTFGASSESATGVPNWDLNGAYQAYTNFDLSLTYDEAPTPATLLTTFNGGTVTPGNVELSTTGGSDPASSVMNRLVLLYDDGSHTAGAWTTNDDFEVTNVQPGEHIRWYVQTEDGTVVVNSATDSFTGATTGGQNAPVDLTPVGGPLGSDVYGGADLSGTCGCSNQIINLPYGISPSNGDLVETADDINVPGAGMALGLSRTYDSGLAAFEVDNSLAPGPLGYGWSYNLGMSLRANATGETVSQENGSELSFVPYSAGGNNSAWCQAAFNYCPSAPRVLATLNHNADGTWSFTRDTVGQTTFTFSSAGALISERDAQGDSLVASQEAPGSGACPSSAAACTVWASSASGRALTLAFDASSPARLVSVTDGAGNTVAYCYFGEACAGSASAGTAQDLYSVVVPGGAMTAYAYDSANSTTALRHDILVETVPTGGQVTNSYDPTGRVVAQDAPSGDVTLTYTGTNTSSTGGATYVCTWPSGGTGACPTAGAPGGAGEETEYQYSGGAVVAETTGFGTSAAATQYDNLDQSTLVANSVQDPNNGVTLNTFSSSSGPEQVADVVKSVDPTGNTTLYAYNSFNQAWCTVQPAQALAGTTCPGSPPASPPPPGASDPWLGATIEFYNGADQLTASTDAMGRTTVYAYTPSGLAVPAELEYCSVSPAQYAVGVTCPAYGTEHPQGTTTKTFDSAGDVLSVTGPDGGTTTYAYTDPAHPGMATVTTSPDGTTTTAKYDAAGQVVSSTVSYGSYQATTLSAYTSAGLLYCTVAPIEVAAGVTCPATAPSPSSPPPDVTSNFYNSSGQLVQTTGPSGATTQYAYDSAGRQFCTVAPEAYSQDVRCPATPPASPPAPGSDPYLGAQVTSYNASGQVAQVTNALGGVTTYTYDGDGNTLSQTVEPAASVPAPISAVGASDVYDGWLGSSSMSGPFSPQHVGDLLVLGVKNDTWPQSVSSVSGAGVGSWAPAGAPFFDGADGQIEQIWYGTVTSAGSSTLTVNWGTTIGNVAVALQEFSAGSSATWALDTEGSSASPFPSLTAAHGSELYFGLGFAWGNAAAGTTPGVTYQVHDPYLVTAWDTATTGTLAPGGTGAGSVAALFSATTSSSAMPSVTTTYTYDADNRQVSQTLGAGTAAATTTLSYYDPNGNVYCSVSADAYALGTYLCPAWDPAWGAAGGQPPSVAQLYATGGWAREVSTSFYDADGELAQQSGPTGATTVSTYSGDGQVACSEDATDMAATLAAEPSASYPYGCASAPSSPPATGSNPGFELKLYDAGGLLSSSTDATGATTRYAYAPDGQVLTTTGPAGQLTTNCYYWQASTCAASAPAGGGPASALYSVTSPPAVGEPNGVTTTYTYYPGGAARATTTPAGTTTQSYNRDGTLACTSRSVPTSGYAATAAVSYTYDTAGLVASRTDGTGTTTYTYDLAGDKTSTDFVPAAGSGLVGRETYYNYVSTGQLAAMTYPEAPAGGSPTVRYGYNSLGEMSSLTDWAANTISFGYDADANLTSVGYPNATATSASYDLADAMTATSAFAGTPSSPGALLAGVSYGVNAAEQVSSETDSGALGGAKSYTYDLAGRLGSATAGSAPATTVAYDASGDPTTLANGDVQAFDADSQLTSSTATSGASETYSYNPTGDRTGATGTVSGSSSFGYDQADQLVSATTPAGSASYAYNGAGLLTGRTQGASTATFTWGTSGGLPLVVDDGTNLYLYGPDGEPVEQASIATGAPEYYFTDAQGSTRALLGAAGTVSAAYTYDPYGNLSSSAGTTSLTQLRYDGQYADPTTGLYYLRARWYDPSTDQFSSVDPLVSQTAQPYAYAGDNPLNAGDPSGMLPAGCGVGGSIQYLEAHCTTSPPPKRCSGSGGASWSPACHPVGPVTTPLSWAKDLLQLLGVPDNLYNQEVLMSWMQEEQGWTNGSNNPISSGDWCNGVNRPFNSAGVQSYPSFTCALTETSRNLLTMSAYVPIVQAFSKDTQSNSNPLGGQGDGWNVIYAIVNSPWGTTAEVETIYLDVLKGTQTALSGKPNPFPKAAGSIVASLAACVSG